MYVVFTVSVISEDVEAANCVSPEYAAVMLSAPAARFALVKVAIPEELTLSVPRRLDPS